MNEQTGPAQATAKQKASDVYQTVVQPKKETLQYLKGWKRPKHAYVLFETKEWHLGHDGQRRLGTGLMTLNAESRPEIAHQVEIYLGKGFRIIDYGNFPKFSDKNPSRAAKAVHYSQGAGINPWDSLEKFIQQKMTSEIAWDEQRAALQSENDVLRKKLQDLEAKKMIKETIIQKAQV